MTPKFSSADPGGGPVAQTAGQSTSEQRQVLRRLGTAGTSQGSGLAGQGDECVEPALAKEKRR